MLSTLRILECNINRMHFLFPFFQHRIQDWITSESSASLSSETMTRLRHEDVCMCARMHLCCGVLLENILGGAGEPGGECCVYNTTKKYTRLSNPLWYIELCTQEPGC